MSTHSRLGALAARIPVDVDERLWNRRRDKQQPASIVRRLPKTIRYDEPHVLVVPQEGPTFESWQAGTRNFYFEAWRTAVERFGDDRVSVLSVERGEKPESWIARLVEMANDIPATHIITHIESDPGSDSTTWHWDVAWAALLRNWGGVLLGVMFDSAYYWITAQSRRLAKMSSNFMVVDICMPMNGSMRRRRPEVGPVNMPLSRPSLELVQDRCRGTEKRWDVSFIGALYPQRVSELDRLKESGVSVAVNPHRLDRTHDFVSSRTNQPSWLDYMAGLAASHLTINFAQSNARQVYQLKTRVIEAMLAGAVVLTDDVDRSSRFFVPDEHYLKFSSLDDLPELVSDALSDRVALTEMALRAHERAEPLVNTGFWEAIDAGLKTRRLPTIPSL